MNSASTTWTRASSPRSSRSSVADRSDSARWPSRSGRTPIRCRMSTSRTSSSRDSWSAHSAGGAPRRSRTSGSVSRLLRNRPRSLVAERPLVLADFDYELPAELIAQEPVGVRGESRLLVVERAARSQGSKAAGDAVRDAMFGDLLSLIPAGDLLVLNSCLLYTSDA